MSHDFLAIAPVRFPSPPSGEEFLHELKWDGFRGLAIVGDSETAIFSKNQRHFTRFGRLALEVRRAVRGRRAVLDGEIVCLNEQGRPDFGALMARRGTPVYAAFDLLGLDGEDLRALPLIERKRRLLELLRQSRTVRYVSHVRGSGPEFFAAACRLDLEGIVSKPADSPYVCRPSPWRKTLNATYSQKGSSRSELFDYPRTA